jgi:hypothetical protein
MNKEVLLKTASILRALAQKINEERLEKEASARKEIMSKLSSLGIEFSDKEVEAIVKNPEVRKVFDKISADIAPGVGSEVAPGESPNAGTLTPEDRFLRFLGL